MAKFSFTCSCGDAMSVDTDTKEEAVKKLKETMTKEKIREHFQEKHSEEPIPSVDEVHIMIDQQMK